MAGLATQYGVTRSTVSGILRRAGVEVRQPRVISPAEIDEAVRLYESGCSLERIGTKLKFTHKTIWRHLVKRGIAMRGPNDWQC
jgi:hypothetical protein